MPAVNPVVMPVRSVLYPLVRFRGDEGSVLRALVSPPLMLLPMVWLPESLSGQCLLWIVIWFSISTLNYILHNHIHVPLSAIRFVNRLLDLTLSFCTGMTSMMSWRIMHVRGHHCDPQILGSAERAPSLPSRRPIAHWGHAALMDKFTIGNALAYSVLSMGPQWWQPLRLTLRKVFSDPSRFSKRYYQYALFEFMVTYGLYAVLLAINPGVAFAFIIMPVVFVLLFTRYMDFLTHVECGDRGLSFANNCFNRTYNRLYWNFGYHMAHHMAPRVHWTRLPEWHDRIVSAWRGAQAPDLRTRPYVIAGLLWPYHLLVEGRRCGW